MEFEAVRSSREWKVVRDTKGDKKVTEFDTVKELDRIDMLRELYSGGRGRLGCSIYSKKFRTIQKRTFQILQISGERGF